MKIKLLLAPSLIVIIIVLLVWWIYPSYTNGQDGIVELQSQLKIEQDKLSAIDQKGKNIDSLYSELTANSEKRETVMTFLPELSREEEIFDNLNYFGKNEGLSVIEINTKKPKDAPVVAPSTATMGSVQNELSGQDGNSALLVPTPAEIEEIETTVSLAGNYQNTKNFLGKLYSLKRFNRVMVAEISVSLDETGQKPKQPSDMLETNLTLRFNFLKKVNQVRDADIAVSDSKFNLDPVSDISSRMNVDIMRLDASAIAGAGRANPFLK